MDEIQRPRHLFVADFVDELRTQLAAGRHDIAFRIFLTLNDRLTTLDPVALAAAVATDPGLTGSARYDALLAGLIEHHCARVGVGAPGWVELPGRFLTELWYVDDSDWGRAHDAASAPAAFLRRGVILSRTELGSV